MAIQDDRAFRRSLEDRIRNRSVATGIPIQRLRRLFAMERFAARLQGTDPGSWMVKGGVALELRLPGRARTTMDLDMGTTDDPGDMPGIVRSALGFDLGDHLSFEIVRSVTVPTEISEAPHQGWDFGMRSLLAGRTFELFPLHIGVGDPVYGAVEEVEVPPIVELPGIEPVRLRLYPLATHVAEKVHAWTRAYASGPSTRIKDYVDICLVATTQSMDGRELRQALQATFQARGTHELPKSLQRPRGELEPEFRRLSEEVGLPQDPDVAQGFMDPVLGGRAEDVWDPVTLRWMAKGDGR